MICAAEGCPREVVSQCRELEATYLDLVMLWAVGGQENIKRLYRNWGGTNFDRSLSWAAGGHKIYYNYVANGGYRRRQGYGACCM